MRCASLVSVLLAFVAAALPAGAQEEFDIVDPLDLVADAVEQSFARALPLPAPSSGVSYSFDPATGNFQRDPTTYGQIYLDRADSLAAGRFNVSFVYQYVGLDSIEGHDADDLRNAGPIPLGDIPAAIDFPGLSVGVDVQQFLLAASYGITDKLEVSLALPLVYSDISAESTLTGAAQAPDGEIVIIQEAFDDDDSTFGVGDVLLRGKYRFLELDEVHLAGGLLLRFPSGNEQDLQGIGYFEVSPALLVSTRMYRPASWARLQGFMNASIDFNTEDVASSDARWGFGLDWAPVDRFTGAIAFLAQNQFARVAPPGTFTAPLCRSDVVTCATDPNARGGTQQLFGLSGDRPDYYTFSIGGRGSVWRDTMFLFANVAIPLNDGFVRTTPIPLVGLEATF